MKCRIDVTFLRQRTIPDFHCSISPLIITGNESNRQLTVDSRAARSSCAQSCAGPPTPPEPLAPQQRILDMPPDFPSRQPPIACWPALFLSLDTLCKRHCPTQLETCIVDYHAYYSTIFQTTFVQLSRTKVIKSIVCAINI